VSARRVVAALALLELAIAIYLEVERARGRAVACPIGGGGCETVQQSSYSKLAGIPLPILGIAGAASIVVLALVPDARARTLTFVLTTAGALFSLYLAGLQAFEIHAYCAWCLSSAVIWIVLAVVTGIAWVRLDAEP
jgi:uncharacterized membrane protein